MDVRQGFRDTVGNTPLIRLKEASENTGCDIYGKAEFLNPGGSVKDRAALYIVKDAEDKGLLKPGGVIVEGTAGNTGIGLALVGCASSYRTIIVIPDTQAKEKKDMLRLAGADLREVPAVPYRDPENYVHVSERIAKEIAESHPHGAIWANQFDNVANRDAHYHGTGPEIWEQTAGEIDAMVCGVGSGGTITGLARYFKGVKPSVEMILADPEGSILAGLVNDGVAGELGSWVVEGIGEDFVPPNCDIDLITKAYSIPDYESLATARELLAVEGVLAGSSTGTLLSAALRYCREQTSAKTVVCLMPDSGNKYLSKMFNDFWMTDQGFIQRPQHGDLRDLISRSFDDRAVVAASPDDTLLSAYGRMRMADVSQLPVLDGDKIIGIIDESDLLLSLYQNQEHFADPVSGFMTDRLEMLAPSEPMENLLPILRADRVAIIVEDGHFLGLITKVDLLNHLRRNAVVEA